MNKIETLATPENLTNGQQTTNTHSIDTFMLLNTPIVPIPEEMLIEHKASFNEPSIPFAIYENNLAVAKLQSVRWLWENRLPLAGITLLDGDHGCGKSLLALELAAHVSSGTPIDGTPIIQGGVVIISPNIDATTTQLQLLTAMGADLSRVQILSYVHDPENSSHPSGYRSFSLPEDLPRLLEAVQLVDARLIVLDPFIDLLSHEMRWTDQRLGSLLADLNLHFIERNVTCLLIRNCSAKGGHARPSVLEKSDRFVKTASSQLLLAHDPMLPDRLLLAHARNIHTALTPTLILQIQPRPTNPYIPHITIQGSHSLVARDFIENRPDTLHRRLLSEHLLSLIADATNPVPVATLYARSHNSSPFQIQRSLRDLLNMGQIERPARGFYSSSHINHISPINVTAATTHIPEPVSQLNSTATTTHIPEPVSQPNPTAATTPILEPVSQLNLTAATTHIPEPISQLNLTAATTPTPTSITTQSLQWINS